jgi:hypothetical protein
MAYIDKRILANDWFRVWMPYTFIPITVPGVRKHVYLPVNRNYKPLGIGTARNLGGADVDYNKYESHFLRFTSDPHKFKDIFVGRSPLYLYSGTPREGDSYGARLQELMRHVRADWKRKGAV